MNVRLKVKVKLEMEVLLGLGLTLGLQLTLCLLVGPRLILVLMPWVEWGLHLVLMLEIEESWVGAGVCNGVRAASRQEAEDGAGTALDVRQLQSN